MKNKKVNIKKLKANGLALALSQILRNPNLPDEIHNGIMRGLNDAENNSLNFALEDFTTSPFYLKKLFAEFKNEKQK